MVFKRECISKRFLPTCKIQTIKLSTTSNKNPMIWSCYTTYTHNTYKSPRRLHLSCSHVYCRHLMDKALDTPNLTTHSMHMLCEHILLINWVLMRKRQNWEKNSPKKCWKILNYWLFGTSVPDGLIYIVRLCYGVWDEALEYTHRMWLVDDNGWCDAQSQVPDMVANF